MKLSDLYLLFCSVSLYSILPMMFYGAVSGSLEIAFGGSAALGIIGVIFGVLAERTFVNEYFQQAR